MEPTTLPKRIDEPPLFLLWRVDDLAPVIGLTLLGVFADHMFAAMVLGLVLVRFAKRFREGSQEGYFLHWLYWLGLVKTQAKTLANPYARRWVS